MFQKTEKNSAMVIFIDFKFGNGRHSLIFIDSHKFILINFEWFFDKKKNLLSHFIKMLKSIKQFKICHWSSFVSWYIFFWQVWLCDVNRCCHHSVEMAMPFSLCVCHHCVSAFRTFFISKWSLFCTGFAIKWMADSGNIKHSAEQDR